MMDDTIAAIATPLGEGGLAVVRLSGPGALTIAEASFEPMGKSSLKPSKAASHTIHYGRIVRRGQVVDEVMLAVLRHHLGHDLRAVEFISKLNRSLLI